MGVGMLSQGRFASDLLWRSNAYLTAFRKLNCKNDVDVILPAYYMLALSCELSLKSYLAASGWSEKSLKTKLSHRMLDIFVETKKEGLPEIDMLEHLVSSLANMNESDFLRYPQSARLDSAPEPAECVKVIETLIEKVRPKVTRAYLRSVAAEAALKKSTRDASLGKT